VQFIQFLNKASPTLFCLGTDSARNKSTAQRLTGNVRIRIEVAARTLVHIILKYASNKHHLIDFPDIVLATSKQGHPVIFMSGYKFGIKRIYSKKTHWQCTRRSLSCLAKIHTLKDMTVVKCYNIHNHKPENYNK
ncbi:Uncharacterized protein OBRU01_07789, partial [Operophtera brumata]